jgi:hypothetical protein
LFIKPSTLESIMQVVGQMLQYCKKRAAWLDAVVGSLMHYSMWSNGGIFRKSLSWSALLFW